MQPIAAAVEDRVVPLTLPNPKKSFASPLIQLQGVSAGYQPGKAVLSDLNLRLDADDRIGLLGANGNGKSTFARLISGRLKPQSGKRRASNNITVGFFAQHQMDDLPPRQTPYEHMLQLMPDASEAQRRARLAAIGFSHDKAETRAENLSGGEKARLLLALASFHGPHLLILDEPTNHLDVDSRESLVRALMQYQGAVILISHDRHLIEACCDRLWLVENSTVRSYDGDMDSYRELALSRRNTQKAGKKRKRSRADLAEKPQLDKAEQRRQAARQRAQLAPLRKTIAAHEKRIARLQKQIDALDVKLSEAGIYQRLPDAAKALVAERGKLAKDLSATEDAWLAASEACEIAQQASDAS